MNIPEHLQDLVVGQSNPWQEGLAAFQEEDYGLCIKHLTTVIDQDRHDWRARLYIAVAFFESGELFQAASHIRWLEANAPDELIRDSAREALSEVQSRMESSVKAQAARKHYGAI